MRLAGTNDKAWSDAVLSEDSKLVRTQLRAKLRVGVERFRERDLSVELSA